MIYTIYMIQCYLLHLHYSAIFTSDGFNQFFGLVVQSTNKSDSPLDPVVLALVCGYFYWQHKVGRVSSCRQGS